MIKLLTSSSAYKRKDYKAALKDSILKIDKLFRKSLKYQKKTSSSENEENQMDEQIEERGEENT